MVQQVYLSPKNVSEALGVSESTVRRWVDAGLIPTSRTEGGHRRISQAEAVRYARSTRTPVVNPAVLGLTEPITQPTDAAGSIDRQLTQLLIDGRSVEARGLLLSRFLAGETIASLADGPLRTALQKIGEIWKHGSEGIFIEHRAVDICFAAVNQLRLLLPDPPADARHAVGCAPANDPYILPTLLAAAALQEAGYHATNLGADTPADTLLAACDRIEPRLVWLSVMAPVKTDAARDIRRLSDALHARGIAVVAGGRFITEALAHAPHVHVAAGMGELLAYARGMLAAPQDAT